MLIQVRDRIQDRQCAAFVQGDGSSRAASGARGEGGFTIIELLIAMTLFSSLLIVITAGFINILRLQTNTVASRNTQQAARYAIEEIVRTGRNSTAVSVPAAPVANVVCFWTSPGNGTMYHRGASDGLFRRALNGLGSNTCPDPVTLVAPPQRVISDDSRVLKLEVTSVPSSPPLANVTLALVASITDPGMVTGGTCDVTAPDQHTCSVTELSSTVSLRGIH